MIATLPSSLPMTESPRSRLLGVAQCRAKVRGALSVGGGRVRVAVVLGADRVVGRVEVKGRAVHAVAVARRARTVREEVAEVGTAVRAADLDPGHAVAEVGVGLDRVLADRPPEARPTGAGVVLGVAREQRLVAHDAAIDPGVVVVPVDAGEGALGTG